MDIKTGYSYNNPQAYIIKQFKIRDEKIAKMQIQIDSLLKAKQGITAELAKTKSYDDLKITELKVLCDENGIDYSGFGTKKAPYISSLEAKGL